MGRIEKLKEFLKVDPQDSFLQHALALEYIKAGEDEPAQKLFENILNHEPAYVGSYYHLAKLLERKGETGQAIAWYQKGMAAAKIAGDEHAYGELKAALEELIY